jgi:hypothetical protein
MAFAARLGPALPIASAQGLEDLNISAVESVGKMAEVEH